MDHESQWPPKVVPLIFYLLVVVCTTLHRIIFLIPPPPSLSLLISRVALSLTIRFVPIYAKNLPRTKTKTYLTLRFERILFNDCPNLCQLIKEEQDQSLLQSYKLVLIYHIGLWESITSILATNYLFITLGCGVYYRYFPHNISKGGSGLAPPW